MFWVLKRRSNDPMVKLLNAYEMSLLRPPNENEAVGDLLIYYEGKTRTPGRITGLLNPPLEMPPLLSERLPNFSGSVLSNVTFDEGFSWLEGFFNALRIVGVSGKLELQFKKEQASQISFRFSDVTRDRVDVIELGAELENPEFRIKNPFYDGKSQYYLVTAVAKSPSISIKVKSADGKVLSLGAEIPNILDNSTGVSIKENADQEITIEGKRLAFGIQTYEMRYNPKLQRLTFTPTGIIRVGTQEKPDLKPALIGGPDGNVFVNITQKEN